MQKYRTTLADIVINIVCILFILLCIDGIFLTLWNVSGQEPIDSFYLGSVTNTLINLIK